MFLSFYVYVLFTFLLIGHHSISDVPRDRGVGSERWLFFGS